VSILNTLVRLYRPANQHAIYCLYNATFVRKFTKIWVISECPRMFILLNLKIHYEKSNGWNFSSEFTADSRGWIQSRWIYVKNIWGGDGKAGVRVTSIGLCIEVC